MNALARHRDNIASIGCLIGRKGLPGCEGRTELHHVSEGSGPRNDWALVPLCHAHHDPDRTGSGFHGMGTKRFCGLYRVPGESEYGLLIWLLEALAQRRAA